MTDEEIKAYLDKVIKSLIVDVDNSIQEKLDCMQKQQYEWHEEFDKKINQIKNIEYLINNTTCSLNDRTDALRNHVDYKTEELTEVINKVCNVDTFIQIEKTLNLFKQLLEIVDDWRS
jgi:hypothetical protein